jgi:hypothetical protein
MTPKAMPTNVGRVTIKITIRSGRVAASFSEL